MTRAGAAPAGKPAKGDGASGDQRDCLSVFFSVSNDAATAARVTDTALPVCAEIADTDEVIVVDDGGRDASGHIVNRLAGLATAQR